MAQLGRFQEFLGKEDKAVFQDLLDQCKIYASFASGMTYSIREVPLLVSIMFGQHKRIIELEKKLRMLENAAKKTPDINSDENGLDRFRKDPTVGLTLRESSF